MEAPTGCDEVARALFVTPMNFAKQMADLARRGFRAARLDQAVEAPDRSVLITFDDAYAHVAAAVTPILREHGFTAVMFVPAAHLGARNAWDAVKHPHLSTLEIATCDQIRAMADGPWEIASHAWRHVDLRLVRRPERQEELECARVTLHKLAGRPVNALAYPFGLSDEDVRMDVARAGYSRAFTAGPGSRRDRYQLPRRPITGRDSLRVFQLKTSPWFSGLRRLKHLMAGRGVGA